MGTTALTKVTPVGPYHDPTVAIANTLDVAFTACDVANGNYIAYTGACLLLVRNAHATTEYEFTLTSQKLTTYNRKADITSYALQATQYAAFKFSNSDGWADSNGQIHLSGNNASIEFLVLSIA